VNSCDELEFNRQQFFVCRALHRAGVVEYFELAPQIRKNLKVAGTQQSASEKRDREPTFALNIFLALLGMPNSNIDGA